MKTLDEFLKKVDFALLKKQKKCLLQISEIASLAINKEVEENINGIINLIDDLQDYAVDEMKIPEDDVFHHEKEYENEYHCEKCDYEWTDIWTAMSDDECPVCGDIYSPVKSTEL